MHAQVMGMLRVLFHLLLMPVVGLTLGLIAHVIVVVFVVAILQRTYCIWRYTLYSFHIGSRFSSVAVNCCWLLPNITVILHQFNVENHSTKNWPNHRLSSYPDRSVLVHRRGDTQLKNATRNLASSTKMKKSFATNFGNKPVPLDS